VGLLGGVLGCAVGYALEVPLIRMYNEFFEFPHLVARVYPGVMGLAVAVAVFFSVLGSVRGVRAVLRLNAAEAMRPGAPARVGRIWLERSRLFWSRLDFRWQMVFRGLFRNRLRSAMGVLASALGASLVLAALGMGDGFDYMVDFQFEKVLLSDYVLSFKDEVDAGAVDEARRMLGVTRAEPVFAVPCAFHHGHRMKRGGVTGITADAELTVPRGTGGRAEPVPPAGLLMTRRLAEFLGVREGGRVTIVPIKGIRRPAAVPVTRIIDSTVGLAVYADYHWLNRLVGESDAVTGVRLLARQTAAEKKAFLRNLKRYPLLESVSDVREEQAKMEHEFVDLMNITTTVLILFAGVIFFGSILNGSLIALAERSREIATFRALGYRRLEVGTIFLRENLLVNLTGALLGLPLGWLMLYGLAIGFQNDLYAMPCVVFPATWVMTPVIALAFALLAHLIVQRDINRQDWQGAIRLKE
jgi:putative ABC transport system permease protein